MELGIFANVTELLELRGNFQSCQEVWILL